MNGSVRRTILRANAFYLGVAAGVGLIAVDLRGVLFGTGPEGRLLAAAPDAALGFIEAHGLALILAITLWRADATRASHFTGAAACALLGICNLMFWQMFIANDAVVLGSVTTALHGSVAVAQFVAGTAARGVESRKPATEVQRSAAVRA